MEQRTELPLVVIAPAEAEKAKGWDIAMTPPGPAPTPTRELALRGSWRAATRKAEPKPPEKVPSCPRWLDHEGKREWRRIVTVLTPLRVLTELDRAMLAAYCQAYADYREAVRHIRRTGKLFSTPQGFLAKNPMVTIANEAFDRMNKAAQQFGLTPSSRTRIHAEPKGGKGDGKARFFKAK